MKKFDWKKYIYKIVVVVLVVIFVGGVGFGAAGILAIEGTYELYTPAEPLSPLPEGNEAAVAYINSVIAKAVEAKPKIEMGSSYSIDDESIANSAENAQLNASVLLASDSIEEAVESRFEAKTADFSESAAEFLKPLTISPADVEKTEISYKYFKCSMCESHIAVEDYFYKCPECGNLNTLNERYSDEYEIAIHIKPDSASAASDCFLNTDCLEQVISEAGKDYYAMAGLNKEITDCAVYATVNRLTDELKHLRFETDSAITASLEFEGAYANLGKADITANAGDKLEYSFTWAALVLDKEEMTVELGSSEVLKATLICDNPVDYTVTWSSDNEDVLTVDDEGYLKTHKKFGDAVITAAYTFKGQEYSDSCLVHVGVPAEGVDLNKGKLSLKSGETFDLVAKFDPKDSTNTVCYWFTNDEKVAKIDENGVVTAVGKGITTVYVVTDYGNYYSSCEVEVTD